MFILGLMGAFIMGAVLSLLGAGGSILTMPILVYLFAVPAVEATSYSLLLVGITALIGSIGYFRQGTVDLRTATFFGIPSIIGVLLARHYLLPAIPDQFDLGISITKDFIIMFAFSVLMILAAIMMIRQNNKEKKQNNLSSKKLKSFIAEELEQIVGVCKAPLSIGGIPKPSQRDGKIASLAAL